MTTGKPIFLAIFFASAAERVTVFGKIDGIGRGAENGNAELFEFAGELQRCLAAELDDDPLQGSLRLLDVNDFEHVFDGEGFEIEPV